MVSSPRSGVHPSIDAHGNNENHIGEKRCGFYGSRTPPPSSTRRPHHAPPHARTLPSSVPARVRTPQPSRQAPVVVSWQPHPWHTNLGQDVDRAPAAATLAGAPSRIGHRDLAGELQVVAPLLSLLPLLGSDNVAIVVQRAARADVAARRGWWWSTTASARVLACALTRCPVAHHPRHRNAWGKEKLSGERRQWRKEDTTKHRGSRENKSAYAIWLVNCLSEVLIEIFALWRSSFLAQYPILWKLQCFLHWNCIYSANRLG
jgi:hypothetical protein